MAVKFEKNQVVIDELNEFSQKIEAFQKREMDPEEFKHRRLIQGIYGQRQPALFMVRIKIPEGNVDESMLEGLAQTAEKFAKPVLHITTRQDIQLYDVKIGNLVPLLNHLADFGITTREASGATIRNIITSPFAGQLREQAFDVRPVAETFSRFFLRHPDTQHLPRKFKLSFSDNDDDYAASAIHDMGFIALNKDGRPGFKIVLGGSLGSVPLLARVYRDFVPLNESLLYALGILRAFNKFGDRSKRAEARLKFQLEKIGWEKFKEHIDQEVKGLIEEKYAFPELAVPPALLEDFNYSNPFDPSGEKELHDWFEQNAIPSVRKDEYMVLVRVPLGDLSVEAARALNEKQKQWHQSKDNEYITLADSQNLVLKGVVVSETEKAGKFREIYEFLKTLGLNGVGHRNFGDVLSCLGSATCAAGITHSPGLGKVLTESLNGEYQNIWLNNSRFDAASIHISGCSNSCARHHVAALGFSGRADTEFAPEQHAPAYNVYFGGAILKDGTARIGKKAAGKVLAKRVPEFIMRVVRDFEENSSPNESLADYLARLEAEKMNLIVDEFNLKNKPAQREEELEFDWGKDSAYVMEYGEGECS